MTAVEDIRSAAALLEGAARGGDVTELQHDTALHLAGIAKALAASIETVQDGELVTDGGRDRLCHVLERIEEHQDRQADALEALAEQQEIQNAVLFELVRELDRSNSIAMKGIPDEASRPKGKATAVQDGVLYLAENVDVDEARRWADE